MKSIRTLFTVLLLSIVSVTVFGQQINTLYFLENAPYRHTLNPAFQPISRVYVGISPVSNITLSAGNNALTFSDLIYKKDDRYITALYPGEGDKLAKLLKNDLRVTENLDMNLFTFGTRVKEKGYFHFSISEHQNGTVVVPGAIYNFLTNGSSVNPNGSQLEMSNLSLQLSLYTQFALGYSYRINDQWSIGGKLKFLYGHAFMDVRTDALKLRMQPDELYAHVDGSINMAMPFLSKMPSTISLQTLSNMVEYFNFSDLRSMTRPQGYGGAIDLGLTYKPHPQVQISLAVTDLGIMHWTTQQGVIYGDSTYTGPEIQYKDLNANTADEYDNGIAGIGDTIAAYAKSFVQNSITAQLLGKKGVNRMPYARINAGVDGNFWDNRIGVGLYSSTQIRDRRVYEELTLGASLRPVNWFNMALSYSFINGRWSSLGFGLSFMPYDGLNLTLVTDYIPLSYADLVFDSGTSLTIPNRLQGLNVGMGITIVVGTNPKKQQQN